MPSKRKQYNVVLDDNTEQLLWNRAAKRQKQPQELIRFLIANHPEILEEAELAGITPQPESVGWGGKRKVKENA